MTSANLVRQEFLTRKVGYALQRSQRVESLISAAFNAFSPAHQVKEENLMERSVDIAVEGRIKLLNA